MKETFQYRLSKDQKREIAQNLIDILQKGSVISDQSRVFISNWILTGHREKRRAFFDVWDMVLKNYLPITRPILFRACKRIGTNNRIVSFTGRLESARRFSEGQGLLLICDTEENLKHEDRFYEPGEYKNTFYPLVSVLKRAKEMGGWRFSETVLTDYIGEDEYIMRINRGKMSCLKWIKN